MPHFYGNDRLADVLDRLPLLKFGIIGLMSVSRCHTGPPTAPNRTASAFFDAINASSVKGSPCTSRDA